MTDTETTGNKLLTVAEVCERLGIRRTTLWELRKAGHLPPLRISPRCPRWRESDVEAYIESTRAAASP